MYQAFISKSGNYRGHQAVIWQLYDRIGDKMDFLKVSFRPAPLWSGKDQKQLLGTLLLLSRYFPGIFMFLYYYFMSTFLIHSLYFLYTILVLSIYFTGTFLVLSGYCTGTCPEGSWLFSISFPLLYNYFS